MQIQRVQNNQTSFQALKGFECGKSLKPIIGETADVIEQKLFKAFNENQYFQELCNKNNVWVDIKPKNTEIIRSGLEVDIFANKLNESKLESREYVIGYNTSKFYDNNDVRINDYSELKKQGYQLQLKTLISDYNFHTENIIESFVKNVEGLKSGIKKFFERSK